LPWPCPLTTYVPARRRGRAGNRRPPERHDPGAPAPNPSRRDPAPEIIPSPARARDRRRSPAPEAPLPISRRFCATGRVD
jgi:hypothetical protein